MDRASYELRISQLLKRYPVVALLGARQVGKTTLARMYAKKAKVPVRYFDLESPEDLALMEEPLLTFDSERSLIILDEVQRRPDLFSVLRVLADRPRGPRFLLLGSASIDLLRQSSESLAGRIAYLRIHPFSMNEVPASMGERLWVRGGFPRSLLAKNEAESFDWRERFLQTFVERDVLALGAPNTPSPAALGRFWSMLAHVHARLLNWSELGRSMGVSDVTVKRYTDLLEGALVLRQLKPWHENIGKRQTKAPKLYFCDSGLLHAHLRIRSKQELIRHPSVGASWEGFCLEEVIRRLAPDGRDAYFWRTHEGAELDLFLPRGRKRIGFEFKRSSKPTITPSMRSALKDLRLHHLYVVHGGAHHFPLAKDVTAVPFNGLSSALDNIAAK